MQIYLLSAIGLLTFWLFCDKSRWRELYPSAMFMTYVRFVEQYILVEILHVWTYDNLTNPFSSYMNTPVIVDLFFYSSMGYLFVQKWPLRRPARLFYVVGWALLFTIDEYIAVLHGTIKFKAPWGVFESFMLFVTALVLLVIQYEFYSRKFKINRTTDPKTP
ncbi:MAG TPA: CBO0543 family protein [Bacilli bacterium]|nr:CBO0543 family protein [Bacilli bacterium]